jgi:hypothetical protein
MGIALLFLLAGSIDASTIDDYQRRVGNARQAVSELNEMLYSDEFDDGQMLRAINLARRELPRTEKVESGSGEVQVDNTWLHNDLDALVQQDTSDDFLSILQRIDSRLAAIEKQIEILRTAPESEISKDEDKRRLAEILKREEYQKAVSADDSLFQKWRNAIMEWLGKVFPRLNLDPAATPGAGSLSTGLQILLYVLLAGAIGYLAYRFLPFFSGRMRSREAKTGRERIILGERIGELETAGDLFAEAERLARSGEARAAIRKGYIALLCNLADRKLIGLARHKTNRDYLKDVRPRGVLFEDLRTATSTFENHWYGSRAADEMAWNKFRDQYERTVKGAKL